MNMCVFVYFFLLLPVNVTWLATSSSFLDVHELWNYNLGLGAEIVPISVAHPAFFLPSATP